MGSDHVVSIIELARLVADIVDPALKIEVKGKMLDSNLFDQYIPDIERAKKELGLRQKISLEEGIRRTIDFYKNLS